MRAALYIRVSTKEQKTDLQRDALLRACQMRELLIVAEYEDVASGADPQRPALTRLFDDARHGKFDVVLVWKYDRFARSVQQLLSALETFRTLGIHFISITEGVDTTTHVGKMVFTFLAGIAEFLREIIRENVKEGLEAARNRGKRIGRPTLEMGTKKKPPVLIDVAQILKMRAQKYSWREIGKRLEISPATALKKAKKGFTNTSPSSSLKVERNEAVTR